MKSLLKKSLILLSLIVLVFTASTGSVNAQASTPAEAVQEIKIQQEKISLLEYQITKIDELINYYNNTSILNLGSTLRDPILKDLLKESGASDDGTGTVVATTAYEWFFRGVKETKINSLNDDKRIKQTDINIAKRKIELLQAQVNGATAQELDAIQKNNQASNRQELQQRLDEVKASGLKIQTLLLEQCSFRKLNAKICILQFFSETSGFGLSAATQLTRLANNLFNLSIWISIKQFTTFANLKAINAAWGIARDICNLFFIFVLLYIALGEILKSFVSFGGKQLLAKVILVALLVNFSAVVPRVVIDISNIFALQFYESMGGGEATTITGAPDLSSRMIKGFNFGNSLDPTTKDGLASAASAYSQIVISNVGQGILMIITAFILVAGGFMFLFRTVVLLFLIIVSPFFFLGMAIPSLGNQTKSWLKTLAAQAFFAPVMLFFMLVVITVATGGDISLQSQLAATGGSSPLVNTLIYYVLVNGMMIGSLVAASKIASSGGGMAAAYGNKFKSWGTGLVAGGAIGAAGFAGRNVIGRTASRLADSDRLKNLATQSGLSGLVGRTALRTSQKTAASSFDARATKVGGSLAKTAGLGKDAGKGGYQAKLNDQIKAQEKFVQESGFTEEQKLTYAESLEKRGRFGVKWLGTPRKRQKAAEKIGDLEARRKVDAENTQIENRNRAAESSNQALDLTVRQARNDAGYVAAKGQLSREETSLKRAEDNLRTAIISGNQAAIDAAKKTVETQTLLVEAARKDFDKLEKPIKDLEATRKKPEELKKYKKKEKPISDQLKEALKEEAEAKKKSGASTPPPATPPTP